MAKAKKQRVKKVALDELTIEDITKACHKNGIKVKFDMAPNLSFEAFGMCFVEGKAGPTVKHLNPETARAEARRLALTEQRRVYVLFATECVEPLPQLCQVGYPRFPELEKKP